MAFIYNDTNRKVSVFALLMCPGVCRTPDRLTLEFGIRRDSDLQFETFRHMNIILWIVFGGLAGWIASMIVGGEAGLGIIGNIIVGIVGAFIGGLIADQFGLGGKPGADRPTSIMSFVWAVIGAIILLALLNLIF